MLDLGFVFCATLALLSLVGLGTRREVWEALRPRFLAYERNVDRSLRFIRSGLRPRRIVIAQVVCLGFAPVVYFGLGRALLASALLLGALLPHVLLARATAERAKKLDAQVEPMLGAIARALVAAPSLGEALASAATVIEAPLSDEIKETLEEFHLGTNLDLALTHLSERVKSEKLRVAVLTLKLGQKSGGKLASILESTAQTMREMERLEGVLRTKTAEGKAQTVVIAVVPIALVGILDSMMPGFFAPLENTVSGNMITLASVGLWVGALFAARQILAVDL